LAPDPAEVQGPPAPPALRPGVNASAAGGGND